MKGLTLQHISPLLLGGRQAGSIVGSTYVLYKQQQGFIPPGLPRAIAAHAAMRQQQRTAEFVANPPDLETSRPTSPCTRAPTTRPTA